MIKHTERTYDIFISYVEADCAWVEGYLINALKAAGVRIHSEEAFRLGVPRVLEFERAIRQSQRILLVLTRDYLAEGFGQFTDLLAQSYGLETATWPVIPLLLRPVDLPPRLAMLEPLDATDPAHWPAVVERLCTEVQRQVPGPTSRPPCPYPGMVPFREEDSDRFFGRDRDVEALLKQLRLHPFLTLIGPSGSGKSSLVFAGLVPALRRSDLIGSGSGWLVRASRPGESPLTALTAALGGDPSDPAQVVSRLLTGEPGVSRLMLVVDQFEELFTQSVSDMDLFQEALLHLVEIPECYVVLTVRADVYPELMSSRLWPEIQAHRVEVLPLDQDGLRQAIVGPAEDVGVFVETALVERLVADAAGEPGILPFVQETLVLLWEKVERRYLPLRAYEALILTARSYRELGDVRLTGLQVAMAERAEVALQALTPEQQDIARRIFLRLVQFGEGRPDTRRQQPALALREAADDPAVFEQTLRQLADHRLLTLGGEEKSAQRSVDIAHEALIQGWPTLQRWLVERREAEQTRRRLESKAREWVRLGRGGGGLLNSVELGEAERWLASADASDLGCGESVLSLVKTSRRTIRRDLLMRVSGMALVVLTIISAIAVYAWQQRTAAQQEARLRGEVVAQLGVARSRQVAAMARNQLASGHEQEALLLSIAAVQGITETEEAANVLRDALHAWRGQDVLCCHADRASHVVFSPNGQYLASISDDHTARLWQIAGDRRVLVLRGHSEELTDVAFSPDNQLLVTTSADDTTRVWDVATGQTLYILEQNDDVVTLDISPDGQTIATGSKDNQVRLWDLRSGEPARPEPLEAEGAIQLVTFSPDGAFLAAASTDGTAWLWHLSSGLHYRFTGHEAPVGAVRFSPDGRYLATRSGDTIRVWTMANLELVELKRTQHDSAIMSMDFSPDSRFLATGSQDMTARLWDLRRPYADPTVLCGHTETVWGVVFSPDGRLLATVGWDDTARLWRVDGGILEATLHGHRDEIWNSAFSPDGRLLATPDSDGEIRLWRVQAGGDLALHSTRSLPPTALATVGEHVAVVGEGGNVELWHPSTGRVQAYTVGESRLDAVAVSVDNARLAVGNVEGSITVLDVATGNVRASWLAHENGVRALLFSPDGAHLASAGGNPEIRLWDLNTGQLVVKLSGHGNDVNGLASDAEKETLFSVGSDGTLRQWSWQTGEEKDSFDVGEPLLAVALTPDGRRLAAGGYGGSAYVWDLTGLEREPPVLAHGTAVRSLAFSADGRWLASGGEDGSVRLWDVETREVIAIRAHGARRVSGVAFSPEVKLLYSTGGDGRVRAWPVPKADVLSLACRRADRNLSESEWKEFLPFLPFTELCQGMLPEPWLESTRLDPPLLVSPPSDPIADDLPTIRYFEAVPGCTVCSGESVTLRWDVGGATAAYLDYGGRRYAVTAPNEEVFSPTEDSTYQLIAVNDAGERRCSLTVSVRPQ